MSARISNINQLSARCAESFYRWSSPRCSIDQAGKRRSSGSLAHIQRQTSFGESQELQSSTFVTVCVSGQLLTRSYSVCDSTVNTELSHPPLLDSVADCETHSAAIISK